MLRLIESHRPRSKSPGATLFSIVAHTMVIGGALASSARSEPTPPPVAADTTLYFTPRPVPTKAPTRPRRTPVKSPVPDTPIIQPVEILPTITDVGTPLAPLTEDPPGPDIPDGPIGLPSGTDVVPDSSALWSDQVDRPVSVTGKQRTPRYPDALRLDGREGSVVACFVVDTLGRVEPGSFRAAATSHPLFTASVRVSVLELRFIPAESGGRRVRQLVEQRFVFALRR